MYPAASYLTMMLATNLRAQVPGYYPSLKSKSEFWLGFYFYVLGAIPRIPYDPVYIYGSKAKTITEVCIVLIYQWTVTR